MKSNEEENSLLSIYHTLEKLRFPPLVNDESDSDDKPVTAAVASHKLGKYIQGGDSRLFLLEWLICTFSDKLLPRSKCPHEERIERIKNSLSLLGLLPVSKHSKNLDYDRYVEGLLGTESSFQSIFKVCTFVQQAVQNRKRAHPDGKFNVVLKRLCENKQHLVNETHDPFPLTFPPAFSELSSHEFRDKYNSFCKKISEESKLATEDTNQIDESFLDLSSDLKQRYKATLEQLVHVAKTHSRPSPQPQPNQPDRDRLIQMNGQFVNLYRRFNKMTVLPAEASGTCAELLKDIRSTLNSL